MAPRSYNWAELPHLARRAMWSLRKPTPDESGETWLLGLLSPAESVLYRSMVLVDRIHAVRSARSVEHLGDHVAVASALHDVGKTNAGLGTFGRVVASLAGLLMSRQAHGWESRPGRRGQIGRYLNHSERGAVALEAAGASELTVAWAREHHLAAAQQSIEPDLAAALHAADN